MRSHDTDIFLQSASLAVIRTVKRRRLRLLHTSARPVTCRRALPLDYSDSNPFKSSLDRNIEAALSEPSPC